MILTNLKLSNFGIFYGTQELRLGPGLYVIHGANGRGKTTILNAVRWALYGHYVDRQRRQVPADVILNKQARREGTMDFSVELRLVDESDDYLVRRKQLISAAGTPPSTLYVERNSIPVTAGDSVRVVNQLLSERVSQFFLFDGEQLQNYESLLFQEDTGSQLIKHSIEQILGLPVLEHALIDLNAVRAELNKRLARHARHTQQLEQVGARAEQAQSDWDSSEAEIKELLEQQEAQQAIIKRSDDYLQRYESSLDQLKNLEALDSRMGELCETRKTVRTDMAGQLQFAWRDILAVAVEPKIQEIRMQLERAEQERTVQVTRDQLQRSLNLGRCVTCNRSLDAEHESHLSLELARLPASASDIQPDHAALGQLPLLSRIVKTNHVDVVIQLDQRLANLDSDILALKQEGGRLREALQNLPENDVSRALRERDEAQQRVGQLRGELDDARQKQREIADRLRRAQEEIRRASVVDPQQAHVGRAIALADDLYGVFEGAKGKYRDELRCAVEASATKVFRQLTNEPEHDRLEINENYGLQIIDSQGSVVSGRSAGQEQVVALSLIAALNRNATRRGPVMMDTPFGRLDPEHRSNILRFLSEIADQVFLLVHGGEIREQDLDVIRPNISEQFDLRRDDTDRTTIVIRSAS